MIRRLPLIFVSIFLGFLFDVMVWGRPLDIAFPFFIITLLALGLYALLVFDKGSTPARKSLWLFLPPVFFATTASLTAQSPLSLKYILSLVFTFLYLVLLPMTYLGGRLEQYSLFDYIINCFRLVISIIFQPIFFSRELVRDIKNNFSSQHHVDTEGVSTGCADILAFPILVVMLGMAWFVYLVFGNQLSTWVNHYWVDLDYGYYVVTLFRIILWSYSIFGFFLHAGTKSWDMRLFVDYPHFLRQSLSYTLSIMVFLVTLIPLIVFSFRLFLYGIPSWTLDRFGLWALAVTSCFVFLLVNWLNQVTIFNGDRERMVHTIMNFLLFLNVLVLLSVAGLNVNLTTYGIHTIRQVVYMRLALSWLAMMFAMFTIFQFLRRERGFSYAALQVTTFLVGTFCLAGIVIPSL